MCIYLLLNLSLDPTIKSLKEGAIPTLNLPQKSIPKRPEFIRSTSAVEKREGILSSSLPETPRNCYNGYDEFKKRILLLSLSPGWNISITEIVEIIKMETVCIIPYIQIFVDSALPFSVRVLG